MRTYNQWMDEYNESHRHPKNQVIHKICVPIILLTVIGLLWALPIPEIFTKLPYLNWATLSVSSWLVFYLTLNVKMFWGMSFQIFIMLWICAQLETWGILVPFCVVFFILAWIGQFYGHQIEGRKPSFLKDVIFLLIGPLWVTRFLYRKMGINV